MEKESAQTRRIVFLLPCLFTSAGLHFSQLSIDLWKDDMNGIESILAEIVPTSLSGKKMIHIMNYRWTRPVSFLSPRM